MTAYQEGCFKWGLKQTSVLVVGNPCSVKFLDQTQS